MAIAGVLYAAGGDVYTVGVDPKTGRLIRVPVRRQTRVIAARVVQPRQIKPLEILPGRDAAPASLDQIIARIAYQHEIRPSFIHAVIKAESNYNPGAVSYKGAVGLMQLMPRTAARYGVRNRFDPLQNIEGGVRYLRDLLDRYDGNHRLALAAYNAGEGAVDRFGGMPPFAETRRFVPRVTDYYVRFRGFDRLRAPEPPPKKLEGPRIYQVTGSNGITRYTTQAP